MAARAHPGGGLGLLGSCLDILLTSGLVCPPLFASSSRLPPHRFIFLHILYIDVFFVGLGLLSPSSLRPAFGHCLLLRIGP